jgi:hypothetical protein
MRSSPLFLLAALVAAGLSASAARAANVHFNSPPTITINSNGTVNAQGTLVGIGNKDLTVTLTVEGTMVVFYYNPGGNQPVGWNKEPVKTIAVQFIPKTLTQNGTASFNLTSPKPVAKPAPNPNWTVVIQSVKITKVTISVTQGGQTTNFTFNY